MGLRFRSTDGLRKYAKDRAPRRSSWYVKALAEMDRKKAKERCPMLDGAPCHDPKCETDCQRPYPQ